MKAAAALEPKDAMKRHLKHIPFYIMAAVILGVYLYAQLLDREGQEALRVLRTLNPSLIERVLILRDAGRGGEVTVSDSANLGTFCSILQNLQSWRPNHPSFVSEIWLTVLMNDGTKHELNVRQKRGDSTGYIYGVRRSAGATTYLFRAQSRAIIGWLNAVDTLPGNSQ